LERLDYGSFKEGFGDCMIVALKSAIEQKELSVDERKPITLSGPRRELEIEWCDTIVPEPLEWLWQNRIAVGNFHIICGEQDSGKGLITAGIVASLTTGKPWFDAPNPNPPSRVLYMSAEDRPKQTLIPRFAVAGADVSKVANVKATVVYGEDGNETARGITSLHADLNAIRKTCKEFDIKLVIVDPLESYIGSNIKMNDATSTRSVLGPLNAFADKTGLAVIAVAHFNKNEMQKVLNRVSGSHTMSCAPRGVWVVSRDKEEPTKAHRSFTCQKFNELSDQDKEGFYWNAVGREFTFPNGSSRSIGVAQFEEHCSLTAEQLIGSGSTTTKKDDGALFAEGYLADGQWHLSADLWAASEEAGFKERTFKTSIGTIRSKIEYDKKANRTYIRLKVKGVEPREIGALPEPEQPSLGDGK
jgi:hypothetical protein